MTRWRDRTLTLLALALAAALLGAMPAGVVPQALAGAAEGAATDPVADAPDAERSGPRQRWRPPRGAVFNDPTGGPAARVAIVTRILDAIRHTRRGDTIRFATYSFDRHDVARALVRAHRRGVNVQVVANDNYISDVQRRLQKVLGTRPDRPSFLMFCRGSCRNGPGGNLHIKIYSFSSSGAADDVIISSSANLTYGGAFAQWNDAYTIRGDRTLFRTWVRLFRQLKRDRRSTPRHLGYSSPDHSVAFQRRLAGALAPGATQVRAERAGSGDPVVRRLSKIGCRAPRGYGVRGRTVVKIIVYAWYGERGETIARTVADLQRRGCRVTVIGSVLGAPSTSILQHAGIPVRAADWDFGRRVSTGGTKIVRGPRCYSHYKFFTVDGAYDGEGVHAVWTGSENWSQVSRGNDEVTLRLNGRAVHRRYTDRFDRMWTDPDATHPVGVEPTRRPCST